MTAGTILLVGTMMKTRTQTMAVFMKESKGRRPSQSEPLPKRRVTIQSPVSSSESNNHPRNRQMSTPQEGKWSETNTNHFLDILLECKRGVGAPYDGKGLTSIFLNHVVHQMRTRSNTKYTTCQVKEKHRRMKADWTAFRALIGTTGVGWNSVENTIDVSLEKFHDLSKCKNFKKFLKKGLPRCNDMNELWIGVEATGAFARSFNDAPLSSDGEQELLRREFHHGEASSQPCENYGKVKSKGKSHMRFDTCASSSPYSRSQSGKSGSRSSMNGSHSSNANDTSIKDQALLAYLRRCEAKAATDVWSLGRVLDEIKGMEELKDNEGNIPHQILFKATDFYGDNAVQREAFMHWPHRTRLWFVMENFQ